MNVSKEQIEKILDFYENSKLLSNEELANCENVYRYDDLKNREINGMLLSTFRKKGKLNIAFTKPSHTLIIGATESGKTSGYINPTIQILSEIKNKSSMFISDPKGELFATNFNKLKEAGYVVRVLNLRNPNYSDFWNPLDELFHEYGFLKNLESNYITEETEGKTIYHFFGMNFMSKEKMKEEMELVRDMIRSKVENDMQSFVNTFISVGDSKDPYWENSARELFLALMFLFLEDSLEDNGITIYNFSLKNIIEFFTKFSADKLASAFERCKKTSKAYEYSASFRQNAENTRACIYSTLSTKLAQYKNYAIMKITSHSNFDVDKINNAPHAFFMITKDEDDSNSQLAKLFLSYVYEKLIYLADLNGGKLERPFYFILDEFGNLPRVNNISNMITAGRSRNIWILMVIQSFAQLDSIYGSAVREVIRDNTNMHIFFGTNDHNTRKEFSLECGLKTILSPQSFLNSKGSTIESFQFETVSLVPVSKLNEMKEGECYITRFKEKTLKSIIERSYKCKEFITEYANIEDVIISNVNHLDAKYLIKKDFGNVKSTNKKTDFNFDF